MIFKFTLSPSGHLSHPSPPLDTHADKPVGITGAATRKCCVPFSNHLLCSIYCQLSSVEPRFQAQGTAAASLTLFPAVIHEPL